MYAVAPSATANATGARYEITAVWPDTYSAIHAVAIAPCAVSRNAPRASQDVQFGRVRIIRKRFGCSRSMTRTTAVIAENSTDTIGPASPISVDRSPMIQSSADSISAPVEMPFVRRYMTRSMPQAFRCGTS